MRRRWQQIDRAKRRLHRVCRDCPRSVTTHVLCGGCYQKAYMARPDALDQFNTQIAQMRHYLAPARYDRRRSGQSSAVLAWMVQIRNAG